MKGKLCDITLFNGNISSSDMGFSGLYIIKSKVFPPEHIEIENGTITYKCIEKYGVYRKDKIFGETYTKIIDCKYDKIIPMPLIEDTNIYYIGIISSGKSKKCDFYINNDILFQGITYNRRTIEIVKSGYFIKLRDAQGLNKIIRNGEVVFSTRYNVVNAYARIDCDANGIEFISDTYLIVVSKNGLCGIYSSKRKLLLPLKYSTIDIDENFYIVLGVKVNFDLFTNDAKKRIMQSMRRGECMQIGEYSEKHDEITRKLATVDGDIVYVIDDERIHYTWNEEFSDFIYEDNEEDDNIPSHWDDYSYEDSLYDALGGQMDAVWNID